MGKPSLKDMDNFGSNRQQQSKQMQDSIVTSQNSPSKSIKKSQEKTVGRPKKNPYGTDKRMAFYMPKELHKKLRIYSAEKDVPMSAIICKLIDKHLKNY